MTSINVFSLSSLMRKVVSNTSASRCFPATPTIATRSSASNTWLYWNQANQNSTPTSNWRSKVTILLARHGKARTSVWCTDRLEDGPEQHLKIGPPPFSLVPVPVQTGMKFPTVSTISPLILSMAGLNLSQSQNRHKGKRSTNLRCMKTTKCHLLAGICTSVFL